MQNLSILKVFKVIGLLLISTSLFAKIIKQDVSESSFKKHEFKEVCGYFNKQHLLIITSKDVDSLDCMGDVVQVAEFCSEKYKATPNYLRAYVKDKEVICQFGERVSISVQCTSDKDQYCQNEKSGCELLKQVFAKNLSLVNNSLIKVGESKILNCHYLNQK